MHELCDAAWDLGQAVALWVQEQDRREQEEALRCVCMRGGVCRSCAWHVGVMQSLAQHSDAEYIAEPVKVSLAGCWRCCSNNYQQLQPVTLPPAHIPIMQPCISIAKPELLHLQNDSMIESSDSDS